MQPAGIALRDRQVSVLLVGHPLGVGVGEQVEVADDRRQRRAELMRDGGDEVFAEVAQLLGTRGVVAVDAAGAPLQLELPDQHRDQQRGGDRRDDEPESRPRIRPPRILCEPPAFDAHERLEPAEALRLRRRGEVGALEPCRLGLVVPAHVRKRGLGDPEGVRAGTGRRDLELRNRGRELLRAQRLALDRGRVMKLEPAERCRGDRDDEEAGRESVEEALLVPVKPDGAPTGHNT